MSKASLAIEGLSGIIKDELAMLGAHLRIARKRRKYSTKVLADLAMLTRGTVERAERGDPGVSLGALGSILFVLQLDEGLKSLAAPESDRHGIALEIGRLPKKVHSSGSGDGGKYDR